MSKVTALSQGAARASKGTQPPHGLTAEQLRTVLETVTGRTATLNNMLMLLQQSRDDPFETSVMIDAAQIVATSIGAMADQALGGEIRGDADCWNYGPNFGGAKNAEGGAE